ncbi:MAG: Fe-Mn family superoxide dismutase, partial [Akkermansia muciniphila]|nr:Fe-Mn family superoxide dismutase [Akkermansia muciniphila]
MAQLTRRYGSPEECARGYTHMGFNRNEQGEWVYREWAPAARELHLIGDFNGWDRSATLMVRDRHGVWEHAYYLRYRNNRRAYIEAFARLVDWSVPEILYTRT